MSAGIYLHIPFCKQACTYCNFHFSTSLRHREEMTQALRKELFLRKEELAGTPIRTVYFGGGTPSILPAADLQHLFDDLARHYDVSLLEEVTLEANPDDLSAAFLRELRRTPVNRFSIGVQSFREADLKVMSRAHTAAEAESSIKRAQDAGFENLSIDLIYGTPGMSDNAWNENLNKVLEYGIPHLSAYALTVEEGTALYHNILKKKSPPVSPEQSAAQAQILMEWSAGNGVEQYEISNFARPGHRAVHNTSYWQGVPYLGIGPSAHSYDGHRTRRWNIANNALYLTGVLGQNTVPHETETLTDANRHNEYIMTALRRIEGINLEQLAAGWGSNAVTSVLDAAVPYLQKSLLLQEENALRLSPAGRLFADGIAADLFVA